MSLDLLPEPLRRPWQVMSRRPRPRNIASLSEARARGKGAEPFVVSFVGPTCIAGAHVFVDSGKRYDWRFALALPVVIVVRRGVDARQTMADLFVIAEAYPTVVDFDRKVAASLVGESKLWPRRRESEQWRALFDD